MLKVKLDLVLDLDLGRRLTETAQIVVTAPLVMVVEQDVDVGQQIRVCRHLQAHKTGNIGGVASETATVRQGVWLMDDGSMVSGAEGP